jgi:uncharacterized membrane protein YgdD (TMEM256/DUF423 family)
MSRPFLFAGSLFAFLGVAAGAFGAHVLKHHLNPEMLTVFETAVRYQMYHALGLLFVSILPETLLNKWISVTRWSFIIGIFLFSGSLCALSLTGITWLGAITPFGGISFLIGWLSLILFALQRK